MTIVWRGMTQAELDAAYDQAAYAPNMQEVLGRYAAGSDRVRERIGPPVRLVYGPGEKERFDLFSPSAVSGKLPINIFIHGGAWRSGEAKNYAFPADLFLNAGAHFAAIDFDWVQDRGGDLLPLANQVTRAIAWIAKHAHEFGGDPERIHLSAHSSGAHLAAVALTTDWQAQFELPQDLIKSALLCSGMYDMEPVRLSARSSYVAFTDESANALSPMRHLNRIAMPIAIAYGSNETPEFQRHSQEFSEAMMANGRQVELLVGENLNHFEILETLADKDRVLGRAALALMGLEG